jgi:hypothetical protein
VVITLRGWFLSSLRQAALRATTRAILASVDGRGKFGVFHVYGGGGTAEGDPEDEVDSPIEALNARKKQGYGYVIDIPYAFDYNSRDTMNVLYHSYRRPIRDWNHRSESQFRYKGINVKVIVCSYGASRKIDAFEAVVLSELERSLKDGGHEPHEP